MSILNYQISAQIYESGSSRIYRARRENDSLPVILKQLKREYPTPEELARFRREYEITRTFKTDGIIRAYDLLSYQHTLVMILEDFGGDSLANILHSRSLTLMEFLELAIAIAGSLTAVHTRHIMHKDINPSNIIWNPRTGQLKLIDFGISSVLSQEQPEMTTVLEGTLPYISPEQTGRMNRAIDYRTDLYSLGVTLYEMLTGQKPFQCEEMLEWVHAHIARTPPPSHAICSLTEGRPEVPVILSDIIMTLMAKNAEDRYQTASGLQADLQTCSKQFQRNVSGQPFTLRQHDRSDRLHIPQKLYGREQELRSLLQAFDHIARPSDKDHPTSTQLVLVAGPAGIGKSSLIYEIRRSITEQRGYFIAGKFDQFNRNIPYSAIITAFQGFVHQILSEPEQQIARWKKRILRAVGANGQVIIEVIPDMKYLIGQQPAVPELPPKEAQNRFNYTFQQFVQALAAPDHPLVIFLDDLHWADLPSLKLLELFMSGVGVPHTLIIGAYRDNEVSETHPFLMTLSEIQKIGASVRMITLTSFTEDTIEQIVADVLKRDPEDIKPVAEFCFHTTGGNPFFIKQLLLLLYEEGSITFEADQGWRWDVRKIQETAATENIIEFMVSKLQKFPQETQQLLRLAACIGNHFDLRTLAIIHEELPKKTLQTLWPALQEGLIIPLDDSYKYIGLAGNGNNHVSDTVRQTLNASFKFLHDQIQQAAYTSIPPSRRQAIHRKIGSLLLANISPGQQEERIFDLVHHLNLSRTLIDNQPEKTELAQLNLLAGKRARLSAAYQPAFAYLQTGVELLGETCWQHQYELTLSLYEETAEAAYLNGNFEEMERLVQCALQHTRKLLDQVKIYEMKIRAYSAQNRTPEAIKTGLQLLKLFNIHIPENPNRLHFLRGWLRTKWALSGKQIEDLLDLPQMHDHDKLAASRILISTGSVAYNVTPELLPLLTFKGVELLVKYGNSSGAAFGYGGYGLVLCGIVGEIEAGYRFGQLALRLQQTSRSKAFETKVMFIVSAFITHWKEHLHTSLQALYQAYQIGLERGDIEYAGYAAVHYFNGAIFSGEELQQLAKKVKLFGNIMTQLNQTTFLHDVQRYRLFFLHITEKTKKYDCFGSEKYNGEKRASSFDQAETRSEIWHSSLLQAILAYLFQKYFHAVEHADKAEKYVHGAVASFSIPVFYFYDSLSRLALYDKVSRKEQQRYLRKVAANQKKMQKWAHYAPMNHLHKWYLVEAERARVAGRIAQAMDYYDKAIELARKHEYLSEEALANELTAKFYHGRHKDHIAKVYMQEARYCYQQWGALAKVQHLEQSFPELLDVPGTTRPDSSTRLAAGTTQTTTVHSLDLAAVLKSAQLIAGDLDQNRLVKALLETLMESTGAQKAVLILHHDKQLRVKAVFQADSGFTNFDPPHPLDTFQALPTGIVRYIANVQETIVFDGASGQGDFTEDAYIVHRQPRSVLCTPILYQNDLLGVLYLEHELTSGLFTPERQQIVAVLCSQVAISLEHTRLYQKLEQQEEERRRYETAKAANQAKSEFLRTMSHEIRNPLNAIILGLSNLARHLDTPELRQRYLAQIRASSTILQNLVNSVLDLSSIEAGKFALTPAPFRLADIARTAVDPFRLALEAEVEMTVALVPDMPSCLYGDGGRLTQILVNLVSNAVKFTREGEITVNFQVASDRDDAPPIKTGDRVWLHGMVQDTGPGIPEEEQDRIFETYFQGKNTKCLSTSGTGGIGMTIVHKIVTAMGGEISLQSHPMPGTRIHVILPFTVCDETELPDNLLLPAVVLPHALRILVVEDNRANRLMLSDWLTGVGCQVMAVESGEKAIECWQRESFDVILLDKQMPGMDGVQTTRTIRRLEQERDGHTPILALTAAATTDDQAQCLEAGMDDYLPKPVDLELLLQKLRSLQSASVTPVPLSEASETVEKDEAAEETEFPFYLDQMPTGWKTNPAKQQKYRQLLVEDIRQSLSRIQQALQHRDSYALSKAAHKLRGATGKIRSRRIHELVSQLETMRRQGDMNKASVILAHLIEELEGVLGGDIKPGQTT